MTTTTLTLTEFLLARITEDEDDAHQAEKDLGRFDRENHANSGAYNGTQGAFVALNLRGDSALNPARVLAECEFKRMTLHRHLGPHVCPANPVHTFYRNDRGCPTLRDMGLSYANRPGYREEWRP